ARPELNAVWRSSRDARRSGFECGVEVAGPQPLEVEGDVRVAGRLQRVDHGLSLLEHDTEVVERHLESCDVAVVADAQRAQTQGTQAGLGSLDGAEHTERDRRAVGNAGCEAGCGGLVPRTQVELARQRTNVVLRKTRVDEWEHRAAIVCR